MSAPMSHGRADELIPWLVNGTLGEDERIAVERHVHDCLPCRAELRQQRALAALVASQRDSHLAPDAGFESLIRRAHVRRRARRSRHLAVAASIAIALIGGTALLLSQRDGPADAGFNTLGVQDDTATRIDIVFTPEVTEAEMRAIVRDIGGTIVAGPSDLGRYTVELMGTPPIGVDVEGALAELRRDRRVRFAGPSFIPLDTR